MRLKQCWLGACVFAIDAALHVIRNELSIIHGNKGEKNNI
jgi:hypothetical protein